jgi:hypothetical protein
MYRLAAQQIEQAARAEPRLAYLIERFNRAIELQNRRDTETLAGLMRMLRNPRSADAEQFADFVRAIVRQEMDSRRT